MRLYHRAMTKERDMLELISDYVRIRNSADSNAANAESLDAIVREFREVVSGEEDAAADSSDIPPIVTRSAEEQRYLDSVEESHNYMSPNWAD